MKVEVAVLGSPFQLVVCTVSVDVKQHSTPTLRDTVRNRDPRGWLVECCFTSTETVGLLGTRAQDVHLDFHTAPELWPRGGERGRLYLTLHCNRKNDWCIKMGSGERHFNVSITVKGKVARPCPQATPFEERGEPKRNRTEVLALNYQPNALPLGQTGSVASGESVVVVVTSLS